MAQPMHFLRQEGYKEQAMETRTGIQCKARRFQVLSGVREGVATTDILPHADTNIICHYAVVVQCTSIDGLELVELEFLSDAA
ncbi:MAG: hypothetical protein NUV55_10600 [Sulfuricaulis sp.]|uniref:hypothetical protein n=1 Tax=Sulfuricaulis sp. TaxID=2003553 RepID=UPI0025F71481|nr:hypothetical protein [Sulfuricaulis sp.]MCR4347631.1 hypothetical protein [Sulfuricaulis sp.]